MPRSRPRVSVASRPPRRGISAWAPSYWELTQQPLQSLIFLLPLIVMYELALPFIAKDEARQTLEDIYAHRLIHSFFEWFGVAGYWLPALIVGAVLLAWHVSRGDRWRLEPRAYGLMLGESILLALPLLVMLTALARHAPPLALAGDAAAQLPPLLQQPPPPTPLGRALLFTIGAGIYEEFVFRLVGIAVIHLIAVDLLAVPRRTGAAAAIVLTAVAFSLHHFSADLPFQWGTFVQLTIAGVYLAFVYLWRGFGIAAATHTFYDVMVVLMRFAADDGVRG